MKQGQKGPQVVELQKLLSFAGYDLIIDGQFGARTQRSVIAFQKRSGLPNTGEVDQITMDTLRMAQSRKSNETHVADPHDYPFPVNQEKRLSPSQFIRQEFPKTQIFLHFTAGGPSARNVIDYWNADEPTIATAFVIDRNTAGVYECFNPDYWSYHLGIKGTKGRLDKASIGVEICNYGPLLRRKGKYYAWPKNYSSVVVPNDEVHHLDRAFRGFSDFQRITDEQLASLELLLVHLVKTYSIKVQSSFDNSFFDFRPDVISRNLPGIWSHSSVREDKLDLMPDDRIVEMLNRIASRK